MKKSLLFVGIVLLGAQGFAAPVRAQTTVAETSEAAALALLNKSAAAYAALDGLSMKTAYYVEGLSDDEGKDLILRGTATLAFEKSGRARIVLSVNPVPQIISVPAKDAASAKLALARAAEYGAPGAQWPLVALVQGKNPLREKSLQVMSGRITRRQNARLLPDNGVAVTIVTKDEDGETPMQTAMYFDPNDHLLRRVDAKGKIEGKRVFSSSILSDVQINPQFAADTFVEPKRIKWDPKLEVGGEPYALTSVDLTKYDGKVVLLDFWATWCGACVREVPNLLANYRKYHSQGLEIIGISLDESKKDLDGFVKTRKLPWTQLFDGKGRNGANAVKYGVRAIPFTLLIGKDGKIAAVNPRGKELEPALVAALAK